MEILGSVFTQLVPDDDYGRNVEQRAVTQAYRLRFFLQDGDLRDFLITSLMDSLKHGGLSEIL
jgi:hypothetical protein